MHECNAVQSGVDWDRSTCYEAELSPFRYYGDCGIYIGGYLRQYIGCYLKVPAHTTDWRSTPDTSLYHMIVLQGPGMSYLLQVPTVRK